MKVVCIGDSLTYGYGVSRSENWVSLINKKYKVDFINNGINGDTSGGMLARFYVDVLEEKPKFVIIMGGINDFIVNNSLGAVKANTMAMVHLAYHNGIIPVIGIGIGVDSDKVRLDWRGITDFEEVNLKMKMYREWVISFSKVFNIKYIDFYKKLENQVICKNIYLADGVHPSKEGHEIMADFLYESIAKLGNL